MWAARLGRIQFYRHRGEFWTNLIRGWVAPAAFGGGLLKYLGVQSRWSIAFAIALPMVVETVGVLLGRWLYRHGGVAADYHLALSADPYKTESIALLTEIRDAVRSARGQKEGAPTVAGPVPRPACGVEATPPAGW